MKVVILAGGRGTRAYPYTEYLPKPMMPVGGRPILVRVMEIFARQGFTKFVVSLGYRKEIIMDYFEGRRFEWEVDLVDTGVDSDTGDRIFNCRDRLGDRFFATYSDGLCDVDLGALLAFHEGHRGHATITTVPLISQYGTVDCDSDGRITAFREKPTLDNMWINAGFFVMNKAIFGDWQGGNLEREVFPVLQSKGMLYALRHKGFFKSMDTYKDQQEIDRLMEQGSPPWMRPLRAAA
ncbi:MAG: NTP transferase domain-containing protein [Alphaproteobacteria bacterium]|nr:NTP transferase domain-containing protein [Alphaproteobacteria bacterium]